MPRNILWIVIVSLTFGLALADDPPASQPSSQPASAPVIVDAADKDAVTKALNTDCILEGVIRLAEWSKTNTVCNIEFSGNENSQARAVIFSRSREDLDPAFGGDVAKALSGAKVRLKGKLRPSNAKSAQLKGRPEMVISRAGQITILEPATSQPTTPEAGK